MDGYVTAFRVTDRVAVPPRNCALMRPRGNTNGGIVLLGTVDAVGELIVGSDMVELAGQLVVQRGPALSSIERNAGTAIVTLNHTLRV